MAKHKKNLKINRSVEKSKKHGKLARRVRNVCFLIVLSFIFIIIIVETGVRLGKFLPKMEERIITARSATMVLHPTLISIIEPDRHLFWKLKPNAQVMGGRVTNRFGHRSPDIETTKDRTRILAIGDSCTFGLGVSYNDSWPARLQKKLDTSYGKDSYEIINTGVPGYSSYQGLAVLKKTAIEFNPDIVVWGLGANDSTTWAGVSDRYFASFFELSPVERLFGWSHAFLIARLSIKTLMVDAPIKNQHELEERLMGDFRPRLVPHEYEANLLDALRFCDAHGIRLIILAFPMTCQVMPEYSTPAMCSLAGKYEAYQEVMHQVAKKTNTPIIDLLAIFNKALPVKVLQDTTMHPSPSGYEIVAQSLLETIQLLNQ